MTDTNKKRDNLSKEASLEKNASTLAKKYQERCKHGLMTVQCFDCMFALVRKGLSDEEIENKVCETIEERAGVGRRYE